MDSTSLKQQQQQQQDEAIRRMKQTQAANTFPPKQAN
jgi:hypothetical protein